MNKTTHPIEPEELMAYLDGELSNGKAAVAAAHLSECGECREVVTELRGVSQALKAWDVGLAGSPASTAISDALDEQTRNRGEIPTPSRTRPEVFGHRWQSVAWIGALAAIALFAFFGSPTLRHAKMATSVDPRSIAQPREQESPYSNVLAPPPPNPSLGLRIENRAKLELVAPDLASKGEVVSNRVAPGSTNLPTPTGPMIIRTAQLTLITKEFDKARANVEAILKRHRGYVGELKVGGSAGSGRTLNATLRVPADQLDASLTELKTLGRVESESQSGQDVTSQYVDLQARLGNARNTEQRLTDMLRQRTGKLSDVLEVEQEVDRVRGEIEQMEAERKTMSNQVGFATLNATITEDYKAQLQVVPPSTSTRLSNAAVAGYKSMVFVAN